MTKNLFLICPFSQLEGFLTRNFGDAYFLTAPAAVFSVVDKEFIAATKGVLEREEIGNVYLVSDIDCRFIEAALREEKPSGLRCEEVISQLHASETAPLEMARKIVLQQVQALNTETFFAREIAQNNIRLHGLVSFRKENRFITIV